jgi:3-phosphoglycerate kinase
MRQKLTLDDIAPSLAGKRVLVRVDYNVPLDEEGRVADDRRIAETLPTVRRVLAAGGRPILLAHLGRPKGKRDEKYSLAPVAGRLGELLSEAKVSLAPDCSGVRAAEAVLRQKPGEVLLLENLRFDPGEEENDLEFARALASMGDVYVNDAFGASHRAHASIAGIPTFLRAAAGLLLAKEIAALEPLLAGPAKPFVALLGGAKVSDKIGVLENLIPKLDAVCVGGAMALTFLAARGVPVGKSRIEKEKLELARGLLARAESARCRFLLPVDHVVAPSLEDEARARTVEAIPDDAMALDIGPQTAKRFADELRKAKTVVWNGPMGVFERRAFAGGTMAMARVLAEVASGGKAVVVVGGGETAEAAEKFGAAAKVTHVSTGGGAFLEYLEGKELPGIAALTDK